MSGFFHCWAGTMQNAYAIIEDTTTGKIYEVASDLFRFCLPPETRVHKSESEKTMNVPAELISLISENLIAINKKLDTL